MTAMPVLSIPVMSQMVSVCLHQSMVQYRPKMFHPLKLQGQEFSQDLYRCSLDCCHGLVLELHGCKINHCDAPMKKDFVK